MRQITTAIIGYGYAAEVLHAPLICQTDSLTLHGVTTTRPERRQLAMQRGLFVYSSVEQLVCDPKVELVVIATPHHTHAPLAIQCLHAGKHVVTDKLMCLNAKEAEAMIATANRNQRMLSIFHNRRFDGDYLAIKRFIDTKELGDLVRIHSYIHTPYKPTKERWRGLRASGGGIFSDWGSHLLDQAVQLNPTRVVAVYCDMLSRVPDLDVETAAYCILEFEDGVRHNIEANSMYHSNQKGYVVWGSKKRLEITGYDPQENKLAQQVLQIKRYDYPLRASLHHTKLQETNKAIPTGNWSLFYQNIADHILNGTPLHITPSSVLRTMQVRDQAFLAASRNQVVSCLI